MHILLVLAHPLPESYAASIAATVKTALEENGHTVDFLDLYSEGFEPELTQVERRGYFDRPFTASGVDPLIARLKAAEGLFFVFPQWWFNFPAILKGFFDRVFAPDTAFLHDLDGGRIRPGLTKIRHFWAFTTTGSPWWLVKFYMGDPVRRILKRGLAVCCGRGVQFRMLNLHDMDRQKEPQLTAHLEKVRRQVLELR